MKLPETFQVLSKFEECLRVDDVLRVTLQMASQFGAEFVLVGLMPKPGLPTDKQMEHIIFGSIPLEWGKRYFQRNYLEADPTIQHVRRSDEMLAWNDESLDRKSVSMCPVMDEAKEFGLINGITIPHLSLDGVRIGASFSGRQMETSSRARSYMNVLSAMALMRALSLTNNKRCFSLSPREKECLLWVADGKSDWDISTILGISQKTVEKHLSNCRQKLNAVNRSQAVVRAFQFGIIR